MMRVIVAAACSVIVFSGPAFAQEPPTAAPPAQGQAKPQAPLRMAFLDLQRVAAESSEGKAASGKVQALTQKKQRQTIAFALACASALVQRLVVADQNAA